MSDLIRRDDAIRELSGACSNWEDDAKVQEIVMAIPSAKQTGDLISRAAAIEAVKETKPIVRSTERNWGKMIAEQHSKELVKALKALPSAEAVPLCDDCTRCTVKALNRPSAEAVQGWIPCSERLPKAEDMYQPPEQRYLCQLEAYGERKFCVLSRLKGAVSPFWDWYGVAIHDFEVTAWMPLPKPYKGGDAE